MKKLRVLGLFLLSFTYSVFAQPSMMQPNAQALVDKALDVARGNQEFQTIFFKQNEKELIRLVREGQNPQAMFIGCSDSRVVPDLIIGSKPGDLFVIRTAGNFVPPYDPQADDGVSATIEYGIEALNVKHIIVCGHSHCGAIQGLFQDLNSEQFAIIKRWLRFGEQAKKATLAVIDPAISKEKMYQVAEELSVIYQLEHLMTYPFVKKRVEEGRLAIHGWYIEIETGRLLYYDIKEYRFKPVTDLLVNKNRQNLLRNY